MCVVVKNILPPKREQQTNATSVTDDFASSQSCSWRTMAIWPSLLTWSHMCALRLANLAVVPPMENTLNYISGNGRCRRFGYQQMKIGWEDLVTLQ